MAKSSVKTGKFGPFVSFVAGSVVLGVVAAGIATPSLAVANVVSSDLVNLAASVSAELPLIDLQSRSTIYAKQGDSWKAIANFYNKNRIPVESDQISDDMKNAVVAVENPSFWTDSGVNVLAAARAAVQNQVSGDIASGASTITMQLVKNQIQEQAENSDDNEGVSAATAQTLTRKLSDMWLALGMTKQYSKDQILTQYLNISFLGGQIYGVEAAARYYFNVSAKNLTLPQAALLAGMLPSPNSYAPDNKDNLDRAKVRRDYVLSKMLEHGYIDQTAYDEAVATPITVDLHTTKRGCALAGYNAFFCEYVVATIQNDSTFGATPSERRATLDRGGLKIYTTLNLDLQKAAYESSQKWLPSTSNNRFATATTSVKVGTGEILAMVQNRTYNVKAKTSSLSETTVNYATDKAYGGSSGFPPGSTFKVFTLLDWLKTGHGLSEYVSAPDAKTVALSSFTNSCDSSTLAGPSWTVHNSINWGQSSMSVLNATVRSANVAFISMAQQLDICDIENIADSMGVTRADGSALDMGPSDLIGSGQVNVSPLTLTNAYAAVANNGTYCTVTPFARVVDSRTNEELSIPASECKQVISPDVTAAATTAFKATINSSTGVTAKGANPNDGTPLAGKTGTTDDATQNWLIGYSTQVVTGTWVGDPLNKANGFQVYSKGVSAYNLKVKIWNEVQAEADKLYGGGEFPAAPSTLTGGSNVSVPDVTGLSVSAATKVLENSGFSVVVGGTVKSAIDKGMVASSSPSAGSSIARGSSVTLRTSDGSQLTVPNVVGQSKDVAIATLQSAGFTNLFTQDVSITDAAQEGQVVTQSIAANATASAGAKIVLSIGTTAAASSGSPAAQ